MDEHYKLPLCIPRVLGLSGSWGPSEHVMHRSNAINSVAISPDGSWIASGSVKTSLVWSANTRGMECDLVGHSDWVRTLAFSSDGSHIVPGSLDIIWSVVEKKTEQVLIG